MNRISWSDVRRVEDAIHRCRAVDYQRGGGACRTEVLAELDSVGPLLDAQGDEEVRTRMRAAVADLHNLAGWTAFDVGEAPAAFAHFAQALELAGADPDLVANIHYRIGRVHLHHRAPQQALAEFERGERAAREHGTELETSLLLANQAWTHATMSRVDDTLRLLDEATSIFARTDQASAPPWLAFYDRTDLFGLTGVIFTELAQRVDTSYTSFAVPALTKAVAGYREKMTRSRALSLVALAVDHFIDDDLDRAVKVGTQAVEAVRRLRSPRTTERMLPLRNEAHRHHHHTGAQGLFDRIVTLTG